MFDFLLKMIKEAAVFVGYLKNGAYPVPLDKDEEDYYVNELFNGNKELGRRKLIEPNLCARYYNQSWLFHDAQNRGGSAGIIRYEEA